MSLKKITISWAEFDDLEDLDIIERKLIESARSAAMNAYAPYSGFFVGAAVMLDDSTIVTGSNVENAAFPSGICAERNALSTAISNFPGRKPVAIAIAARNQEGQTEDPVPPCGSCRQVIAEEECRTGTPVKIILAGRKKYLVIEKGGDLLPLQFNGMNLRGCLP